MIIEYLEEALAAVFVSDAWKGLMKLLRFKTPKRFSSFQIGKLVQQVGDLRKSNLAQTKELKAVKKELVIWKRRYDELKTDYSNLMIRFANLEKAVNRGKV